MKKSRIAIAAARSGGHIIPGMTLAHQYYTQHPEAEVLFFSTNNKFDKKIISQHTMSIKNITLSLDNVPKHWYLYPIFLAQFFGSFIKSIYYLTRNRPSHVILMGGYISIPVCLAALILRIPRELYELNAVPGSATKLLAPLATKIDVCFACAQNYFNSKKTVISPYPLRFNNHKILWPVRPEVRVLRCETSNLEGRASKDELAKLNLDPARTTLFILGGSQGSLSLNKIILTCLQENSDLNKTLNIIHQTGAQDSTNWAKTYHAMDIPAIVFDYHHDLSTYYAVADIVIGRAGAGTIFETLFFSKPCILIPLEIAGNDHQLQNAQAIAKQHPQMFTIIRQSDLAHSTQKLVEALAMLIHK